MEINYESILKTFRAESLDHLRNMEESIIAIESRPEDEEALRTVFRIAHTIKGSASCMSLQGVTEFAHVLEDVLEPLRKHRLAVSAPLVSLLLQSVDALREMVAVAVIGEDEISPKHRALMNRLIEEASRDGSECEGLTDGAPSFGDQNPPRPAEDVIGEQGRTLRVDIDKLDSLLNLTGEIAIARTRIRLMIEERAGTAGLDILEAYQQSDQLYLNLQELVTKVRMVPLDSTFRQYIRTVRDLAKLQGKAARLVIEGGDAEVDTTVVEHLRDPLAHMIRNAIDHGIEKPEIRMTSGKDTVGSITLRAFREAGQIVIEVEDDGAGLDRDRIVARARDLGLVPPQQEPGEREISQLIFEPGFSTTERVTEFSGRGVGMDVVRRNMEALGGRVTIHSQHGEGTCVTICLPLSLAIVEGLAVGVSGETFVIPLSTVVECLDLDESDEARRRESGVINLRGEMVPYVRLSKVFDLGSNAPMRENLVVVRNESGMAGLAVDDLFGESQVVLKHLGKLFHGLPGLSGSTILGNGRVALILDVPTLLRSVIYQPGRMELASV